MMSSTNKLPVALLQLPVSKYVAENLEQVEQVVGEVKTQNPKVKLVILSECFNASYGHRHFAKTPEKVPAGETCQLLSKLAQTLGIYIIGGTIIEEAAAGKLYHTCTVWAPTGKLIGRHRKMHLCTLNIDSEHYGGITCNEGLLITPGNDITIVEVEGHKIGIGICHDVRFEELARIYRNKGCEMIVYPSAFCICQGPMHWELLQRSRANDNQLFVVSCAPARDTMTCYVAYGHSMIVNPWGVVQREAGIGREVIVDEIDFDMVAAVRRQIPLFPQRRTDIYNTELIKK